MRRAAPETEFDVRELDALPRVDIAYAYAGNDGTFVRAFPKAGAREIVAASKAPGILTPAETDALKDAVAAGVIVVLSSRVGSGRVFPLSKSREAGFLTADNLNPQKSRILLALALARTGDPAEIRRMFAAY